MNEWNLSLCGRGTDTVSMGLEVDNSKGTAEKHVRLHVCFLASTLNCQFGWLINLVIFLEMRAAPSQVGWMSSLLIRPVLLQKVCQLSVKPTLFVKFLRICSWVKDKCSRRLKDRSRLCWQLRGCNSGLFIWGKNWSGRGGCYQFDGQYIAFIIGHKF